MGLGKIPVEMCKPVHPKIEIILDYWLLQGQNFTSFFQNISWFMSAFVSPLRNTMYSSSLASIKCLFVLEAFKDGFTFPFKGTWSVKIDLSRFSHPGYQNMASKN